MLKDGTYRAWCMSKPGNAWRKIRGRITQRPTNFSWVIEDAFAGSGIPMSSAEFDWIRNQGVDAIITMTEDALPHEWTGRLDEYLHVPTPDLAAPEMDGIDRAVAFAHKTIGEKKKVMVHCAAGMGRAGTILACYLIKHKGLSADEAIAKIRHMRPGSIQSESQECVIAAYEKHIRETN